MRELGAIVFTIAFVIFAWSVASASESNRALKTCLQYYGYHPKDFDTFDFTKAAKCHSDYRIGVMKTEYAEMRDFLKHNPRYRVPGQSNNRCWGKPRVMPFESAYIERTGDGFRAGVSYKDTLPAGCYENGPWDNRELNGENR